MAWDLADCEDSELITIADRLNRCKESRIMLDLELSNEEFKLKYIHKRKQMAVARSSRGMLYIIPLTIVEILCVVLFVTAVKDLDFGDGYSLGTPLLMLVSLLGAIFCGVLYIRLWVPEYKMLKKLNPRGKNRDKDKGVVTYDKEREQTVEKISILKAQIDNVDTEIYNLSRKKIEKEKVIKAELEKRQAALNAAASTTNDKKSGFTVKEETVSVEQVDEMLMQYNENLELCNREMSRLKLEDLKLQDKIISIEEKMTELKNHVFKLVLIGTFLTIIIGFFSGKFMHFLGIIWCLIVIPYLMWIVKNYKMPFVEYFVEHEHPQIQDYAFVNSLEPYYKKRIELGRDIAGKAYEINAWETKIHNVKTLNIL